MAPRSIRHHGGCAPWVYIALIGALAGAFVLATAWLDGGRDMLPRLLWTQPRWTLRYTTFRMLVNALPGLLAAFALLAWTRRAGFAFGLAFGLEALVYGINALKVKNLVTPLMPADFEMVGQLTHGGARLFTGYVPHIGLVGLALAAGIAMLVAWFRLEPPQLSARPLRWRAAATAVLLGALVTLIAGMPFWRAVYNGQALDMKPWSPAATRQHAGLISSLMLFNLEYGARGRKANVHRALALMAKHEPGIAARMRHPADAIAPAKPDIVVILSESFFDPAIMRGYPRGTDPTPNFHRLARHGRSGWLHVPTFGGGTVRTEFEVLTGLSLRYFPRMRFPYLQIHQQRIPSMVWLLKHAGYTTLAVHGNDPDFWNRSEAFTELGFDRFISIDDFPTNDKANDGEYLSDKAFTDELLRQLPGSGPPRFVLGISIEAHGPYESSPGINVRARDAIPVPAGVIDPEARVELQNYIYHMQHADQQLGRLVDTLAKRKRRTLVLFFGDHLPSLLPAYEEAGFTNGEGARVQTPPYLLVDTAHMDRTMRENAAAWELPGMLLTEARIHNDPYFVLTQRVGPELEALTRDRGAPPAPETHRQRQLDRGMRNVADLRLNRKLDALWPRAEAMAQDTPAPGVPSTVVDPVPPDADDPVP